MRILLLSMPDSFEHTPSLTMRMPNAALASLSGNLDERHQVAVADLICVQADVVGTVRRLLQEIRPELVGLSIMTFQRRTALALVQIIRSMHPSARIVVGGYDPSLAAECYEDPAAGVDFIVRGEGELTFRSLVDALEGGKPFDQIAGLSWRSGSAFVRNPPRRVSPLGEEIRPPRRSARVLRNYTFLGRQIDIVETSRGCTYDCSFCSIVEMRGRNFETWSVDRALDDMADARRHGARVVFLVDDNITLDVRRFEALCRGIIERGLATMDFIVQAMTSSIAAHGETLAPLMRRAGFRYVFLGIENVIDHDLTFLKARAKNTQRTAGRAAGNASARACEYIRRNGMYVVGGLIVGNPDDTRESIEVNLEFARKYVDWPYIQHPTPYPGTPMTAAFTAENLIANEDVADYDGTTAVVRTRHLGPEEVEFLRWRAERWMKCRHFPSVLRHDPLFIGRHALSMFAHTFRGCSWRTMLRLEDERAAFRRYKAIRRREREYLRDDTRGAHVRACEGAAPSLRAPATDRAGESPPRLRPPAEGLRAKAGAWGGAPR